MSESWAIAAFYFRRMARKPLLLVFLLAIPFTLLVAEFAAFGRVTRNPQATPIPIRVARQSRSQLADSFVSCLAKQPGHPLIVSESDKGQGDLVTLNGSTPLGVTINFTSTSRVSSLLEYSIIRICALQSASSDEAGTLPLRRSVSQSEPAAVSGSAFMAHFFPGLGLFGALFLSQAMASLVWRDYERNAYTRLRTMPLRFFSLVLGPVLFVSIGAAAALATLFAFCAAITNPATLTSPLLWALILNFALCVAGIQLVSGLMTGSYRAATAVSSSTNMMLAFLGGGFVPLSLYPPFLRAAAYALPNGAGQDAIVQLLTGNGNPSDLMWRLVTVSLWAVILLSAAIALQARRTRT